jgi:hypothetical protein
MTKKKSELIKLRITPEQKNRARGLAEIYTNGNVSDWVRFCLENYLPAMKKPDRQ